MQDLSATPPPAPLEAAPQSSSASQRSVPLQVVLTGNPNCGKTTLFNVLTGLRAKVGNYPGVTVERKEGRLLGATREAEISVLDLPGTYSLSAQSLDEQIARDALLHRLPGVPAPDLVVVVVDASNLQRNLYFATQVIELGYPTVLALNMIDVAQENGFLIDVEGLQKRLGIPVYPLVASRKEGVEALRQALRRAATDPLPAPPPRLFHRLPEPFGKEIEGLAKLLPGVSSRIQPRSQALLLLSDEKFVESGPGANEVPQAVAAARGRLEEAGLDWRSVVIESRYGVVAELEQAVTRRLRAATENFSDRLDRILTHRLWGVIIFVAIMTLMFQSIFSFAKWPMETLTWAVDGFGSWVSSWLPPGDLNTLLVAGVIKGVGAVIVFLPQILLLFFFISILEDTGYMARAAFLMDRMMSKVGLHGKSFIPMLSSFACAIPGIMATRTIESPKDRLVTILVAPLMSCSARLPVYAVLIAACVPDRRIWGFLQLQGLTLLAMYLLGVVVALLMAWLFKKTLLKGPAPMLIMELPGYKRPVLRVVLRHMWDRSQLFLRRAGTVILGINILLWFMATYPKSGSATQQFSAERAAAVRTLFPDAQSPEAVVRRSSEVLARFSEAHSATNASPERALFDRLAELEREEKGERLRASFAGRFGRLIEPLIAPLGFDWKMGIGIVASFAAREVFVSTMSTVYNVGEYDKSSAGTSSLAATLRRQKHPDGTPVYTTLVAITLMVFYVFALQCVSTVAVVRRETNSWKWPLFQWVYMGVLAWTLAWLTFQIGRWLRLG